MKNRYKKFKKAVWAGASTGVVTGLILMGTANTALADTVDSSIPKFNQEIKLSSPVHTIGRWNSLKRAGVLATQLGLDPTEVAGELKSGKGIKQILQENGIAPQEFGKNFAGRKSQTKRNRKQGLNKTPAAASEQ